MEQNPGSTPKATPARTGQGVERARGNLIKAMGEAGDRSREKERLSVAADGDQGPMGLPET